MPSKPTRTLSEIEKIFIKEANAGGFSVDYTEEGEPVAYGARGTDSLFSMNVREYEERDGGGSYMIAD